MKAAFELSSFASRTLYLISLIPAETHSLPQQV